MKKTIYLCLLAMALLCTASKRLVAQTISSYSDMPFCASAYDSASVVESGYVAFDSIIVYNGDGTSSVFAPSYSGGGGAWYYPNHLYTSPGTYTKKIVLKSGGVRVDSVSYVYVWDPCEIIYVGYYSDNNSNCIMDGGDTWIYSGPAVVRVDSAGVPVDTLTSPWGWYYAAHGPVGTVYTFTVITNPSGFIPTCPTSGVVSVTITSTYGYSTADIGFQCDPSACLDNGIYGNFRAAITGARSYLQLTSSRCTAGTQTATVTFSPKYSVASVSGASYTVSGNVATINVSGLSATNAKWVTIYYNPVGTLTLGDTAKTTVTIPTAGDCATGNNTVVSIDTLRSSCDPNHKSAMPVATITAGSKLEYMLQFENTGNDTAHNIHVMDTLSDNVDINTIKVTGGSAPCKMYLSTWAGHNVVKFDFPGINLLDSSHHGLCDGFVLFTINAKSTITPGTNIDNRAGIYFDANAVVMTNGVRNTVPGTSGVVNINNNVVEIYPNPVNDKLMVTTDSKAFGTMTISNTVGQVVIAQQVSNNVNEVNVKSLPSGIYYVTLRGTGGVKVVKFEKL